MTNTSLFVLVTCTYIPPPQRSVKNFEESLLGAATSFVSSITETFVAMTLVFHPVLFLGMTTLQTVTLSAYSHSMGVSGSDTWITVSE